MPKVKHNHCNKGKETRTYVTWNKMKDRCSNKNHVAYHRYGGRGINVCDRWKEFANFLEDMGERPIRCTLDRIDNDKGYCKENCRWANNRTQIENRSNVLIDFDTAVLISIDILNGLNRSKTAKKYGCTTKIISNIMCETEWIGALKKAEEITGKIYIKKEINRFISDSDAVDIWVLILSGERGVDIAQKYNCSSQTVCDIKKERKHKGTKDIALNIINKGTTD